MTETGSSQRTTWWREVVIAFAIVGVVSAYYSAKLTRAEQRAQQAEARLKQLESKLGAQEPRIIIPMEQLERDQTEQERENREQGAPENLACPYGTRLRRVNLIDLTKKSNAKRMDGETDWECISEPRRREPGF